MTILSVFKIKGILNIIQEPLALESVVDEERKTTIMDFVADDSVSNNPEESYIDIICRASSRICFLF